MTISGNYYDEIMAFLQEMSSPDKLDFFVFGPADDGDVTVWPVNEEPADLLYSGIYVVNNCGTHYYETILVRDDGSIAYFPEMHPNDRLADAFSDIYGINVYPNLQAFKDAFTNK